MLFYLFIMQLLRKIHQTFSVTLPAIMLIRNIQTLLKFMCTADQLTLQPFCAWPSDTQQHECYRKFSSHLAISPTLTLPVWKMYMLSSTSAASVRVTYLSVCACKKDTFGIRRGKIYAQMIRHKRNSRQSGFLRN